MRPVRATRSYEGQWVTRHAILAAPQVSPRRTAEKTNVGISDPAMSLHLQASASEAARL